MQNLDFVNGRAVGKSVVPRARFGIQNAISNLRIGVRGQPD